MIKILLILSIVASTCLTNPSFMKNSVLRNLAQVLENPIVKEMSEVNTMNQTPNSTLKQNMVANPNATKNDSTSNDMSTINKTLEMMGTNITKLERLWNQTQKELVATGLVNQTQLNYMVGTLDNFFNELSNLAETVKITPNATNLNATIPNATNPNVTLPNATNPNVTLPNTTNPNATTPNAINPNATTPNATNPNATLPNATNPNATLPNATNPNVTLPNATNPNNTNANDILKMMGTSIVDLESSWNPTKSELVKTGLVTNKDLYKMILAGENILRHISNLAQTVSTTTSNDSQTEHIAQKSLAQPVEITLSEEQKNLLIQREHDIVKAEAETNSGHKLQDVAKAELAEYKLLQSQLPKSKLEENVNAKISADKKSDNERIEEFKKRIDNNLEKLKVSLDQEIGAGSKAKTSSGSEEYHKKIMEELKQLREEYNDAKDKAENHFVKHYTKAKNHVKDAINLLHKPKMDVMHSTEEVQIEYNIKELAQAEGNGTFGKVPNQNFEQVDNKYDKDQISSLKREKGFELKNQIKNASGSETEKVKINLENLESGKINPALVDPIHIQPLTVYDKGFEPLGKVEPPGMEHWTHFANPTAKNSYLKTDGPKYPSELHTIGTIVTGCHEQVNQCIMHCRMEFSYNKEGGNYFTANQHGVFSMTNQSLYTEFLTKVANCSETCLSDQKCIHDITFLHKNYSKNCYGLLAECSTPTNCGTYNNFDCMSNCSGDLCYPLYRFVQDIKDFKRSVVSLKKDSKEKLKFDSSHDLKEIKLALVASSEKSRKAEDVKKLTELKLKMEESHLKKQSKTIKKEMKDEGKIEKVRLMSMAKDIELKVADMIYSLKGAVVTASAALSKKIHAIDMERREKLKKAEENTKGMIKENPDNVEELKKTGRKIVQLIKEQSKEEIALARSIYRQRSDLVKSKALAQSAILEKRPETTENAQLLSNLAQFIGSLDEKED